ncbi:MAG TPA: hypothetical protein VFA68_14645 [Terriglobales bacterium]|nr:hypothetical protein [Terriglobales bacterium]
MGRASVQPRNRQKTVTALFLFALLLSTQYTLAQGPCEGETAEIPPAAQCPPNIPLPQGSFQAVPLMDGDVSMTWPHNPPGIAPKGIETVTLYGQYGNDEQQPGPAKNHFDRGKQLGQQVVPLDLTGQPDPNYGAIVFLFIGFSNCDIEICGGNVNIWPADGGGLTRQPCATNCPNPFNHNVGVPYNQIAGEMPQRSFLYQVYNPTPHLVGSHVYVFNGAMGAQTLATWDPNGFYTGNDCMFPGLPQTDPECNYDRVKNDLQSRGFSESQVQVIFMKTSTALPQCDLSGLHCSAGSTTPDAYISEQFMGNIMRYLKQGLPNNNPPVPPRYPNLKQVFITSRIYGGYARNASGINGGTTAGCLNPEPFAYQTVTKL